MLGCAGVSFWASNNLGYGGCNVVAAVRPWQQPNRPQQQSFIITNLYGSTVLAETVVRTGPAYMSGSCLCRVAPERVVLRLRDGLV